MNPSSQTDHLDLKTDQQILYVEDKNLLPFRIQIMEFKLYNVNYPLSKYHAIGKLNFVRLFDPVPSFSKFVHPCLQRLSFRKSSYLCLLKMIQKEIYKTFHVFHYWSGLKKWGVKIAFGVFSHLQFGKHTITNQLYICTLTHFEM